jgi:hypothetical protein
MLPRLEGFLEKKDNRFIILKADAEISDEETGMDIEVNPSNNVVGVRVSTFDNFYHHKLISSQRFPRKCLTSLMWLTREDGNSAQLKIQSNWSLFQGRESSRTTTC